MSDVLPCDDPQVHLAGWTRFVDGQGDVVGSGNHVAVGRAFWLCREVGIAARATRVPATRKVVAGEVSVVPGGPGPT